MKKQAAEAKPETKDIKAEEQKPKVACPLPNGLGLGSPSVRTLRPLIPAFRTSPALPLNDGSKSALRLLNPIPLPLPTLNLGTDLHLRSIPGRTGQNLDPTP